MRWSNNRCRHRHRRFYSHPLSRQSQKAWLEFGLKSRALLLEVDIMAAHLLALVLDCIQFIVETLEHITFVFDISNCDLAF